MEEEKCSRASLITAPERCER